MRVRAHLAGVEEWRERWFQERSVFNHAVRRRTGLLPLRLEIWLRRRDCADGLTYGPSYGAREIEGWRGKREELRVLKEEETQKASGCLLSHERTQASAGCAPLDVRPPLPASLSPILRLQASGSDRSD